MDKTKDSKKDAWNFTNIFDGLISGSTVFIGGFGDPGNPVSLLHHLSNSDIHNLKLITEARLLKGSSLRQLVLNQQVSSFTTSYYKMLPEEKELFETGKLEFHVVPMGTLVEQIRAGGAGIPAFYTYTGADTLVELGGCATKVEIHKDGNRFNIMTEPKKTSVIKGRKALYYESLMADFALIHAHTADKFGNVCFKGTGANLSDIMAMAAKVTIVEAEHIVENGQLNPDQIHLPGIFVDRMVKCDQQFRDLKESMSLFPERKETVHRETKELIAQKVSEQIKDGEYVNIGLGTPLLVADYCAERDSVVVQVENGMLGVKAEVGSKEREFEMRGPGGAQPAFFSPKLGYSFFNSLTSFSMIRGGRMNVTVLGALEVSETGDFAGWTSQKAAKNEWNGMGGAMDLCTPRSTRVIIAMQHCCAGGQPKLVTKCSFPVTAVGVVHTVVTDKAVFRVDQDKGFILMEIHDKATTLESLKAITAANFIDGREDMEIQ